MVMKITELLKKDTIILDLRSTEKNGVIDELVQKLDDAGRLSDKDRYREAILTRENESTTGIGEGIAIPHAKTSAVQTPSIAFGRSKGGTDYESLDGQPAHLVFMIAASEGANESHLQTLSRLSTLLMDEGFRETLLQASSEEEILEAVDQKEKEKLGEDEAEQTAQASPAGGAADAGIPTYLAVTACPTGIAHTYMAADSLKAKAKEMDMRLKVETNGSDGVKNRLTDEDIANADAIIVAADTKVEMDRFDGKPVISVPVADGIRKPEQLLNRAKQKDASIHRASGSDTKSENTGEKRGVINTIYRHLMNGVSNMLPFVVGGGILIAISFLWGIEPENTFAVALNAIGGQFAFGLFIAVLAGFIAMSIADRPGFAPGMIAGLMATQGVGEDPVTAGFLGGLIAGFLAGYMALGIKKALAGLPRIFDGIKTILFYPVLNIMITGLIMYFIIIPPVATLNIFLQDWLGGLGTGNIILLGILLGGMMAVDMGGPINKAAFTFGIAMITAGNFAPHAAVMAGGMVPPIGIALATTFFKNRFTKEQRDAGVSNYLMGGFFITEGAIPFAAADPARVIPAAVIGSATAGGLAMFFNSELLAPHGGFIVFFLNAVQGGGPWLYALSILIGSVVTMLLLAILKKPIRA
ncbi:PTS system D-fructose-specific IIA component (F1P-forming) (Frc family) /PTS system D-fructose-specific IIB component (F1P-forming) (Frc family) /PTS system D-fructose-specific IIC component (F1P-forming) (Frc family) [Sinobaca qinghaiensis]|uniref:PTS system D-fructose-specific IIA component (F1P-forming) (Frc family) /PTS system D-fructose-specific IIB component (F1P-forming) (Frc family) /PTS system D-fructose-specific IIC component (F1P-f... n=2 Tax=Sinobaca qinghaiensis TaxID=342944 RepID=A0A419UVZ1_9BACL|nr:PTS system D-fructose-specific IIA component (F1P-forming) (Frc family) /PTS system D-fructose-specific IIB component (F1P-forming) (Frc family) /PTS system D-fructose-specific IIC component (F1P-forming) (Frc family) [Sinobaca qinghaiensis]